MPSLVDSPVQALVDFGPLAEATAQNVQFFGTLSITQQPAGTTSGAILPTQPIVAVLNVRGATDTTYNGPVSVAVTGAGSLTAGTNPLTAVSGVATWTDIRVTGVGASQLVFTVTGRGSVTSNSFTLA